MTSKKSHSISQRHRNHTDRIFPVHPPHLPQVKPSRVHCAAALSPPRHKSCDPRAKQPHTHIWDTAAAPESLALGEIPHSPELEPNAAFSLVLPEASDSSPCHPFRNTPASVERLSVEAGSVRFEQVPRNIDFSPTGLAPRSNIEQTVDSDLNLAVARESEILTNPSVVSQAMSTLGFMMPAQYGSVNHYGPPPPPDQHNYPAMHQQAYPDPRAQPQPITSGAYAPTYAPVQEIKPVLPPHQHSPLSRSPYQQPMGPIRTSPAPMAYPSTSTEAPLGSPSHNYTYPIAPANIAGQGLHSLTNNTTTFPPAPLYPPNSYDMGGYSSLPPTLYPLSSTATSYTSFESLSTPGVPTGSPGSGVSSPSSSTMPRVLNSRPKPQCWEHGCNGRQFSTFSNLLRHQREKSGTAAKSYCPRCGAEFTRTTARNGHMAHEKCKPRRTSDSSR